MLWIGCPGSVLEERGGRKGVYAQDTMEVEQREQPRVLDPGRVAVTEAVSLVAMRLPASSSSMLQATRTAEVIASSFQLRRLIELAQGHTTSKSRSLDRPQRLRPQEEDDRP